MGCGKFLLHAPCAQHRASVRLWEATGPRSGVGEEQSEDPGDLPKLAQGSWHHKVAEDERFSNSLAPQMPLDAAEELSRKSGLRPESSLGPKEKGWEESSG